MFQIKERHCSLLSYYIVIKTSRKSLAMLLSHYNTLCYVHQWTHFGQTFAIEISSQLLATMDNLDNIFLELLLGMAASALRLEKLRIPSLSETWELKEVGERVFGTRVMSSSRRWSSEPLELEFRMSIR